MVVVNLCVTVAAEDYQPGTTVFTLPMTTTADTDMITVDLTILSDEAVEGLHVFTAAVMDTDLVMPWSQATINLMDNDCKFIVLFSCM